MHGRLHTKVLQASPHRWGILWHRLPPHALHGPPWIQAQEARKPVCPEVIAIFFLCGLSKFQPFVAASVCKLTDACPWKSSPVSHVPPGCTDSRSTPWPTSCSCKPPPASRAPSRPSARRGPVPSAAQEAARRKELKIRRGGGSPACREARQLPPSLRSFGRLYYYYYFFCLD